jgi:16S rRNA C1402 N4-methylase RsmH
MHIPVLLKETLSILQPEKDKNYIDATFGEGNLSFEIVKLIKPKVASI